MEACPLNSAYVFIKKRVALCHKAQTTALLIDFRFGHVL